MRKAKLALAGECRQPQIADHRDVLVGLQQRLLKAHTCAGCSGYLDSFAADHPAVDQVRQECGVA